MNKEDLSTVHAAEIADSDVHDHGDSSYARSFVCLYLPLSVAAHITVRGPGAISIAIRSPSTPSQHGIVL